VTELRRTNVLGVHWLAATMVRSTGSAAEASLERKGYRACVRVRLGDLQVTLRCTKRRDVVMNRSRLTTFVLRAAGRIAAAVTTGFVTVACGGNESGASTTSPTSAATSVATTPATTEAPSPTATVPTETGGPSGLRRPRRNAGVKPPHRPLPRSPPSLQPATTQAAVPTARTAAPAEPGAAVSVQLPGNASDLR
jgi:hypothetical protein